MNFLTKIMGLLSPPLMLLNMLGGIASGIWLAILGQWGIIGYGIAMLFIGVFALCLLMMPGLLLAAPAAMLAEKENKIGLYFFGFLSALYTVAVLTVWCVGIMYFFAQQANANSYIPTLIWSYGAATGPLTYMAQKEMQGGGGEASLIATFFAQVAYIISAIIAIFLPVTIIDIVIIFGGIMVIGLIFQFRMAIAIDKYA